MSSPGAGLRRVVPTHDEARLLARWQPAPSAGLPVTDAYEVARRLGYEQGYAAARAETDTSAEAQQRGIGVALTEAAASVARTRVEAVETVAAEVVELALELTEVLLQRELTQSDSVETEALSRALALAPTGEDLVVRLHPDHDLELTEIEGLAPGVNVKVVADPAIEPGGCVLEVGACRIDAQIGAAMARARALIAVSTPVEAHRVEAHR